MRCDKCGAENAEPAILTAHDDDGLTIDELRLLLCVHHTVELANAVEAKEN